jgi:hypothetical protein
MGSAGSRGEEEIFFGGLTRGFTPGYHIASLQDFRFGSLLSRKWLVAKATARTEGFEQVFAEGKEAGKRNGTFGTNETVSGRNGFSD